MENITSIPAPRVAFIDPRTGLMAREWYRFFLNLFTLTGGGQSDLSISDLAVAPSVQDTSTLANVGPESQLASMVAKYDDAIASIQGAYLNPPPSFAYQFDPLAYCAPALSTKPGEALTRSNDTNVTLTLGGSPTAALLTAVSLTLGWSGLLGLARGGTNADLSATGGASQVLKQVSSGAAVTVGQLAASDLSNSTTGSGAVVLAGTPTLTTPNIGAATGTSLQTTDFLQTSGGSVRANASGNVVNTGEIGSFQGATNGVGISVPGATGIPLGLLNKDTTGDNIFAAFYTEASPTQRGSIDYDRGGVLTRYNTTSDGRLKTGVRDADYHGDLIDRIQIREYDWLTGEHGFGVVAQELAEVVPQAVSRGDSGETISRTWGVDYSKLVPLLVQEVQSLRRRVTNLRNQHGR